MSSETTVAALSVVIILCCDQLSYREPEQVVRSRVTLVPVYTTVRDATGRLVPGLTKDAFQLLEDGTPIEITQFSPQPEPLSIAIMLDVSRSVAERKHRIEGVLPFLRALGPADRASLGTFGAEIAVGANLTNDLSEFARVLNEEAWVDGGTPLWQAISEAIRSLSGVSGRRAVLLYTDGADTGNLPNWGGNRSTVEREALASNCMVYFVRPIVRASERTRPLMDAAKTLAEMTGGGYYEVSHDDDQELEFRRVADELRHQYLLGFPPTAADGRMHRIEVRVSIPGMKARARSAYFALAEK